MKKNLLTAIWMTVVTTVLFGILYPLAVTGLARVIFPHQANGELIVINGKTVGSSLIGQHSPRPDISAHGHRLPAPQRYDRRRLRRWRIELGTDQQRSDRHA